MNSPAQFSDKRLIGFFILLLLCATGYLIWSSISNISDRTYAESGQLELSKTKIENSALPLDGDWHFIWGELLSPKEFSKDNGETMSLPSVWNGHAYKGEVLPAHGIGTYQLQVILESEQEDSDLAIYIPFIHSSYALYLDNELITTDGKVAATAQESEPSIRTKIVPLKHNSDTLTLTLQVANFDYALGGIWQSPRIGERTVVQAHYDRQLAFDLFIFGGLFLMSIYHIALFYLRKKVKSNLYFGIICFFLATKTLFTGVAFYYTLFPTASYELGLKVIHISIFGTTVFLWLFLRDLFKKEFPVLVSKILIAVAGLGILTTLIFPSHIYSQLMLPFWIVSGIVILFILRGVYLSASRNRQGALLILAGIVCFLITVIHDIAIDLKMIQSVYLAGAGFFLFIFSQALMLAVTFTNSFKKVENLTTDLMNTNRSFSRFVPSEYLSYLKKKSILDVELGDSLQEEMTIFFCDIRSYTTLSERMLPETNFAFINDYLGRVVQFIHTNDGIVNQYMGDGILALFARNSESALRAAVQIQKSVSKVTELGGFQLEESLEIGIGIHSGPLILGMMGTEKRMSPGVISDTVNTASRLEGLTKFFGAQIVISEPSLTQIEDGSAFDYRFLGKVQVKGKLQVLPIYEVLDGLSDDLKRIKIKTREDFENGLVVYFQKEFSQASELFKKVLTTNPGDIAAEIYYENSKRYLKNGVASDWEGALSMQIK